MIKRRFFRFEHGNRDDPSGSSSSSDESEVEVDASDESEVEGDVGADVGEKGEPSSSSGYESEDSSEDEVNLDSSGLPTSDDDDDDDVPAQNIIGSRSSGKGTKLATAQRSSEKDVSSFDTMGCVLKRKSVFKCRLCPSIVCLSEETLKAHLNSKRHARSVKLLKEGRLKRMLNEVGKVEEETYSDNPETSSDSEKKSAKPKKKKKKGPWKRKKGSKPETKLGKAKPSTDKREKRRKDDS